MLTRDHLETAVQRGIISDDQRDALLNLTLAPKPRPAAGLSIDENMQLVGGGNDLFVTIGVVLLGAGLYFALFAVLGPQPLLLSVVMAAALWLVAEFVTRLYRMRLSSTVIGVGFLVCVFVALSTWIRSRYNLEIPDNPIQIFAMRTQIGTAGGLLGGGMIAASILWFWRFRVPIMAAALALSVTGLAFLFTALFLYDGVTDGRILLPTAEQIPDVIAQALYMPLLCGLLIFGTGVALDLHDRERTTIWSDCAFWLHVISAPLLVHPLFILATGQEVVFGEIEPGTGAMIGLAVLIAVFVYVALAIDRRSLLIPTLAYFGSLGIYYLVNSAANQTGIPPFALILVVTGALIMIFGAGWQRIRNLIVAPTLPRSVLAKLPPIRV